MKCQQMNSLCCLSEVSGAAALEDLLSFWLFCLQAEWVHSENVTGCLVPLHHQLPLLRLLFAFCFFDFSFYGVSCKFDPIVQLSVVYCRSSLFPYELFLVACSCTSKLSVECLFPFRVYRKTFQYYITYVTLPFELLSTMTVKMCQEEHLVFLLLHYVFLNFSSPLWVLFCRKSELQDVTNSCWLIKIN